MLVLRAVGLFAILFLLGLGIAFVATRDPRYLRLAAKTLQVLVLVGVAAGLVYLFGRVLVFL
ncbi:MAG: hypothetical protein AB7P08_01690 [Burkholderiales bacterium]